MQQRVGVLNLWWLLTKSIVSFTFLVFIHYNVTYRSEKMAPPGVFDEVMVLFSLWRSVFSVFLWCWLFWAAAVAAVMTVQLFWCWCIDCCDCGLVSVMTVQIFSGWCFTVAAAVCLFTLGSAAVRSSFGGSFIGNCFGSGGAWLCDWILVAIMRIQRHSLHFYCLVFSFIRGFYARIVLFFGWIVSSIVN